MGPKIGFVLDLLNWPFIMQGVKKKIIKVIRVLLYIYIYIYIYEKFGHDWIWA